MADKPNAEALERAIAELKRVTPENYPWAGDDFHDEGAVADVCLMDDAIATILNAVVSGDLVPAHRQNIDSMETGE